MWKKPARLLLGLVAFALLSSCSKSDKDPQVFLPILMSPDGANLTALHDRYCNPSQVNLTDNVLTQENFTAIFQCANYDSSLNGLEPLFTSADFPEFLRSVNLVTQSKNTQGLKETLNDWLKEGPQGTSRADRLLPLVASVVKNPSFQDFLPVLSNFLQAGKDIWKDLLPGLADVVYTELFPDNLENAFVIFNSFSGPQKQSRDEEKDYATPIKDFARFLKSDVDGKTASMQALELLNNVNDLELQGTSLYEFLENMLEKGTISSYFLDSGALRGEVVDPKLNDSPDEPAVACANLNDTPEQRQQCSLERMFRRGPNGADAPITQLANLVAELDKDHPELLPSLAAWFAANGARVSKGLSGYVVRAQVVTNLSRLNLNSFFTKYTQAHGIDTSSDVNSDQFAQFVKEALTSAEFATWVGTVVPGINQEAFGERNASFLNGSDVVANIAALYKAREIQDFSRKIFVSPVPEATMPLQDAMKKLSNKHRREELQVAFGGKTQSIEKHLGDFWVTAVRGHLGEDVVLEYVIKLAQTLLTQLTGDFKAKNQPIAEWFFNSPYGNPGTTEMIVGYAIKELDMLTKYYKYKDWLKGGFADEAFADESDKKAFQMLIDQVPNFVLYIRSGMSRSGGDLTRAMARDQDGYLVRTYVNLIVKATETGWVRKGVRLIEAWQNRPGHTARNKKFIPSDDIADRRKYKVGVEALERVIRSLITPEREGDFTTSTLGRLVTPLKSIVSDGRRTDTERFMKTGAQQLLDLSDQEINDFMRDFNNAKPPGSAGARRETYKSISDMMRNENCPDVIKHLAGLFQENAVKPALDFFAQKIDDGSLPKVLLFIRRLLGFGK